MCLPSDEVLQLRLGAVSQTTLVAAPLVCASVPAGLAHRRLAGSCCLGYLSGYLSVLVTVVYVGAAVGIVSRSRSVALARRWLRFAVRALSVSVADAHLVGQDCCR
eukprot:COSAG06_NODE_4122_length_4548_cov_102.653405_4_plen_106_part_00